MPAPPPRQLKALACGKMALIYLADYGDFGVLIKRYRIPS